MFFSSKKNKMNYMKAQAKSSVSALLLVAIMGAGVFTFIHALDMSKGNHHSGDCPVIVGVQSLCQTDPIDHLTLWQRAITTNLEVFIYSLLLLSCLCFVSYTHRLFVDHSPPRKALIRIFNAQLPIGLYTRIFADGILNPKVP